MKLPELNLRDFFTPDQLRVMALFVATEVAAKLAPLAAHLRVGALAIEAQQHTSTTPEFDRGVVKGLSVAA